MFENGKREKKVKRREKLAKVKMEARAGGRLECRAFCVLIHPYKCIYKTMASASGRGGNEALLGVSGKGRAFSREK